jgi:hypothetical protein
MRPIAIAIALLCVLLAAPVANAANDPVGSGQTRLVLDRGFASFLGKDAITLTTKAPAKRKGSSLLLPVSAGSLDPTTGKGQVQQEGTLVFANARKKVPLRDITIKTKHSPLIAKVGGSQLKLAASKALSSRRQGFGSAFKAKALALSAKLATRLTKKLRPKVPFQEGQPLGSLLTQTQPELITLLGANRATVAFDPAFVAKLNSLFVSLNPVFPAEHQGATFSFPIAIGGAIAPDGSQGMLRTAGSAELLQLGGGQLFWKELWFDLGARQDSAEAEALPSPPYAGKTGRTGVFALGGTAVSSDPRARTIAVSGAPLTLEASTAATLDQLFAGGREDFRAGEAAGTVSFVAQGQ